MKVRQSTRAETAPEVMSSERRDSACKNVWRGCNAVEYSAMHHTHKYFIIVSKFHNIHTVCAYHQEPW